jgi:hypothetical protein
MSQRGWLLGLFFPFSGHVGLISILVGLESSVIVPFPHPLALTAYEWSHQLTLQTMQSPELKARLHQVRMQTVAIIASEADYFNSSWTQSNCHPSLSSLALQLQNVSFTTNTLAYKGEYYNVENTFIWLRTGANGRLQ